MPVAALAALGDLLDRAGTISVAVETTRGPHVTPELFVVHADRIWCLAAAPTLKVKILAERPRAGILVRSGGDTAVLAADAIVIDPGRPLAAIGGAGIAAVRAPTVVASFLARNHLEMTGAAMDAVSLQLGAPPARRVLLGFAPVASALIRGDELVSATGWGPAPSGGRAAIDDEHDVPLHDLPGDLASLLTRDEVALGWTTATGPLALPAAWEHDARQATVAADLFGAVGAAPRGPCSVTVDGWTGLGPTGKRGVMLRGAGEATADGPFVRIRVAADRAAYWQGIDTGTVA